MKIAIIGGYGNMGKWFARFLKSDGFQVVIAGRDPAKLAEAAKELGVAYADNKRAAAEADAVILSVPIDSFEEVAREIGPRIRTGQLVFDVTSVKEKPVEAMHRHIKKGTILGVHPMFGPGAKSLKGQRFVLTPTDSYEDDLANKAKDYLEERGARVILMQPKEHDELMSIVLGLSHFIALVSADALVSLGKLKEAQAASGTTYRTLLTLSEGVVSEDADFYSSLQMNLPGLAKIEGLFKDKAAEWAGLVKDGNRQEFIRKMKALKATFEKEDPGFGSAYGDMYRLIED